MSPKNSFTALPYLLVVAFCGLGILLGVLYGSNFAKLRSESFGRSWKSLKGSIEFSKIIDATPDTVWAQSTNGGLYQFLRGQWIEIQHVPEDIYVENIRPVEIGTTCPHAESFKYLKYPSGNLIECAYAVALGMDVMPGRISYYALLDNGKIWALSYSGGSMLDGLVYTLAFAVLSSIFGLLLVFAIRFVARALKMGNPKSKYDQSEAG